MLRAVWSREVLFAGLCCIFVIAAQAGINRKYFGAEIYRFVSPFFHWSLFIPLVHTTPLRTLSFPRLSHDCRWLESQRAALYARRVYQRSVGKHGGSTAAGAATGSRAKRGGVERGRCVLHHRSDHPYPGERFSSGRIVFGENAGRERCEGEIFSGSRRGTVPLRA